MPLQKKGHRVIHGIKYDMYYVSFHNPLSEANSSKKNYVALVDVNARTAISGYITYNDIVYGWKLSDVDGRLKINCKDDQTGRELARIIGECIQT